MRVASRCVSAVDLRASASAILSAGAFVRLPTRLLYTRFSRGSGLLSCGEEVQLPNLVQFIHSLSFQKRPNTAG